MRAAAVQINSNADRQENLARAEALVRAAAADGASLVALPERFDLRGTPDDYERTAEPLETSEAAAWARRLARELRVDLIAGSISERRPGHDKLSNTSLHIGPDGAIKAVYRKVHLFDVARLAEARGNLPSLQNRVPGAYRWPHPTKPTQPMEAHA